MDRAVGHPQPAWPLPDVEPRLVATYGGKAFGATRPASGGRARRHAGVDILAPRGSLVVAMEDGELVADQPFLGPGAVALLQQTNTGPVILYGEVEPDSWREFGLRVGSPVQRGQAIARVGVTPGGSSMLHLETYRQGTRRNARWFADTFPPPSLLEPTAYLEAAAAGQPVSPVETPEHEHDDDHDHETSEPMDEDDDLHVGRYEDDPEGGHSWNWSAKDRGWTTQQLRDYWGNDPAYDAPFSVDRPDETIPACRRAGGEFVEPNMCRFPDGHMCRAYDVYREPGCPPGHDQADPSTPADDNPQDDPDSEGEGGDDIDPIPWVPDIGPPGTGGEKLFGWAIVALIAFAVLTDK